MFAVLIKDGVGLCLNSPLRLFLLSGAALTPKESSWAPVQVAPLPHCFCSRDTDYFFGSNGAHRAPFSLKLHFKPNETLEYNARYRNFCRNSLLASPITLPLVWRSSWQQGWLCLESLFPTKEAQSTGVRVLLQWSTPGNPGWKIPACSPSSQNPGEASHPSAKPLLKLGHLRFRWGKPSAWITVYGEYFPVVWAHSSRPVVLFPSDMFMETLLAGIRPVVHLFCSASGRSGVCGGEDRTSAPSSILGC